MSIYNRVKNAYDAFTSTEKTKNSLTNEAADFLRYGNRNRPLLQSWSQVEMSDQDMYTGYSYAAINKRANRASALGKKFLYTDAAPVMMDAAKKKDTELIHPYLDLIKKSKDFTTRKFWHDISTYLDLEGVYYLMAVRNIGKNSDGSVRVGSVQKFTMLNPYQIKRILRESDGTLGGYLETRGGIYREIPKEMIIEVRLLNPFDNDLPYSMTDAAKESQFTMKQAGDYARHSIKGNINSPGAITTDVVLEDHIFDNFVSRIKNHEKGEPLYGNGAGAINWQSMQIDLDKAALDKINDIHRSTLFAVSGVSDMLMGQQKAGTGREVSKTQKDEFTENAVMPQIEDIVDALNLDYRKWYPEWEKNEYEICLDNPLESDREAELKDIEIREAELALRDSLVAKGYEFEIASRYAHGDIGLEELGEPTLEPEITDDEADAIAAREMGMDDDSTDQTPPDNSPGGSPYAPSSNRLLAENRFVGREENEKKLAAARKRMKAKKKQMADETKAKRAAEKEKKKQEDSKPVVKVEVTTSNQADSGLKARNQVAARDYPSLYDGMDIDVDNLGCIMINTEIIPVVQYVKNPLGDIYTEGDHTGVSGETEPHATLLFGLLENGNVWKDKVDMVLSDWECPEVVIDEVSFFDLGESYAIIGLLKKTPELIDGHERLTLLPHVNTFSEYHPHITLAYIKHDVDPDKWIKALGKVYNGQKVATKDINYGDLPEDDYTDNSFKAKQAILTPSEGHRSHDCSEHESSINSTLEKAQNALEPDTRDRVILQESNLYQAVSQLEASLALEVIAAVRNGKLGEAQALLTKAQKKDFTNQLVVTLEGFFTILFPIYASQLMNSRSGQFDKQGVFAMTNDVEEYIRVSARKAADSHLDTVLKDLQGAITFAHANATEEALIGLVEEGARKQEGSILAKLPNNPNREDIIKAIQKGKFDDMEIYKRARKLAREGNGLDAITRQLQKEYQKISQNRARTIARHETNRVFNMAQYQADVQFLTEANLMDQAYKRLYNRANDPCPVCAELIEDSRRNPIPFTQNFANLGETLTATYKKENGKTAVQKVPINYEAIVAGNIHVNCRCEYELLIRQPDGSFLNNLDCRVLNGPGYNPYRAKDGKFAAGTKAKTSMGTYIDEKLNRVSSVGALHPGDSGFAPEGDKAMAQIAKSLKLDKKPSIYTDNEAKEAIQDGATEMFRGYRTDKASEFKKSYADDAELRVGHGVFGSGTYMTPVRDIAVFYANMDSKNVGHYIIKKDAKGIDYDKAKKSMIAEHQNVQTVYSKIAKSLSPQERERLQANIRTIYSDTGRWAAVAGYDYISYPGASGGTEMAVVNRGVVGVVK